MSFAVCFIHDNFCMVLHVPHSPICKFMGKTFLLQFMQVYIVLNCRIPETVSACSSSSLSSSEVAVGSIASYLTWRHDREIGNSRNWRSRTSSHRTRNKMAALHHVVEY